MTTEEICYTPIGYVENEFEEWTPVDTLRNVTMRIVLRPELEAGLLELDAGDWIQVIFHFSKIEPDDVRLQLYPRDDTSRPLHGVFATRTQYRPNKIGATIAQIERIDGHTLYVRHLDTLNNTPVLDIKRVAETFDLPGASEENYEGDDDA